MDDHHTFLSIGRSHKLLIWNVKQPPMPSVDDSSTLTLVDVSVFLKRCGQDFTYAFQVPGLVPSLVLSIKELDEEWESFRMVSLYYFIFADQLNRTDNPDDQAGATSARVTSQKKGTSCRAII